VDPDFSHARIHTDFQGEHIEGDYPMLAGNYLEYYDNIYDAIRSGSSLIVTPDQARNVIKIIEAAYLSSHSAQVVTL
jgi:predicted dehydrogenase